MSLRPSAALGLPTLGKLRLWTRQALEAHNSKCGYVHFCQVLLPPCSGVRSPASWGWGGPCRGSGSQTPSPAHWGSCTNGKGGRNGSCSVPGLQSHQCLLESVVQVDVSEAIQVLWESSLETNVRTPSPRPPNGLESIWFLAINNCGLKYRESFLLSKLNSGWYSRWGWPRDDKAKELSRWEADPTKEWQIRRNKKLQWSRQAGPRVWALESQTRDELWP